MRHLGSLVLCLVLGPLIYLAAGYGITEYVDSQTDIARDDAAGYLTMTVSAMALVLAAGVYTLLILARLSPVGTVLVGLALFGVAMWSMFEPGSFVDTMPRELLGVRGLTTAPAGPVSLLLSVPLLFTVFSPRRWRRWGSPIAAVAPAPGYAQPPTPYGGTPSYGAPTSGSPSYHPPAYGPPAYGSPAYGPPVPAESTAEYPKAPGYDSETTHRL